MAINEHLEESCMEIRRKYRRANNKGKPATPIN